MIPDRIVARRVTCPAMGTLTNSLRSVLTFAVGIPVTAACAVVVILHTLLRPPGGLLDRVPGFWGRTWCRVAGVKLTVEGLERIDPEQAYVVISNHQSAFDIFAHFAALPVPIRFLAKQELFKIPLFGAAMRRIGIVEVDRGAGRATHQAVNRGAAANMSLGRSLMIYPEGTRSRDGAMLPFKKGAFAIARNLGVPIVPTAITGSREVWSPGSKMIRAGHITVTILDPISTENMTLRDLSGLTEHAHSLIAKVADVEATPEPSDSLR